MKLKGLLLGMAALAVYAPFVCAESPGSETQILDEIVVTSTRTEHTVMETPSNISVIKAKYIKAMDAKNIGEVIKKLPGVFYTNSSGLEPKINLRGTHIGMSPGAMVLVNGIPMGLGKYGYTDLESIPVETIERVEVVKGPMSSLYGGDSARGVINIITKRGKKTFGGNVQVAVGSYDDRRVSALINGSNGKMDYSLNVKKKEADGYKDETWLDNIYVNGELGYWLSEDTRIGMYANVTDKERSLAKKLTESQRDEDPKQATDYSLTDNTDIVSGISLTMKKQAWDLSSNVYYKYRDKTYDNYLNATSTPYKEDLTEDILGTRNIFTYKQPVMSRANKLSFGFDYDYDTIDLTKMEGTKTHPELPVSTFVAEDSGKFSSKKMGLFVQDEFSFTKDLTLTAGIRYDYFEFDNDFVDDANDSDLDFDRFNPRIAANYNVMKDTSLYGGFSQSYRSPSLYDFYKTGGADYTLRPETFTQYELGVRHRFAKWLNLDATVFHIVIEDMLVSAYDSAGEYQGKMNINEATMQGFELALSGQPHDRVTYSLAYTFTDAEYTADVFVRTGKIQGENISGNDVTKVPHHRLNVDFGIDLLRTNVGDLVWNINGMIQDEYPMNNTNTRYYKAYGLLNTLVRWKAASYEVFIGVDNILDYDYDGYAYASSYSDTEYFYPAPGATVTAGLEYKF